jgi:hypothetical protein
MARPHAAKPLSAARPSSGRGRAACAGRRQRRLTRPRNRSDSAVLRVRHSLLALQKAEALPIKTTTKRGLMVAGDLACEPAMASAPSDGSEVVHRYHIALRVWHRVELTAGNPLADLQRVIQISQGGPTNIKRTRTAAV